MLMKLKLYIVVLCLISAFFVAQTITLQWEGYKENDYGTEKVTYPFFTNHSYLVDNNSVYVSLSYKTDSQVVLDQLQWQELSPRDVKDLSINSLSSNPRVSISYDMDDKQQQYATINAEALKAENNKIYKLVSFTIAKTGKKVSALYKNGAQKIGTSDNPLKSGTFYKIRVDKSGVFKITKQFLQQNGLNPANINPRNFRIYGNGGLMLPEYNQDYRYSALQQDAIQVVGEEDGVWNDNDYALFYAQGPNGYNLFGSGNRRTDYRSDQTKNVVNIYENYAYYYINFDIGPGDRITELDNAVPTQLITRYDDYQYINEEKYNLSKLGRIWTGDLIPGSKELTFTTKSPIQPNDVISFKTQIIAYTAQLGSAQISFNNNSTQRNISASDSDYVTIKHEGSLSNLTGNTLQFNYSTNTSSSPKAAFYFDYAEVQYKEDLVFNGTQMNFRSYDIAENSNNLYGFSMGNNAGVEQVWDVSDVTKPKRMINKNNQNNVFNFGYLANSSFFNNEFTAFKAASAFDPVFVGRIENQDLASISNVDYLIITQPAMLSQAERLAAYHRSDESYNVQVVDVNKIYNEYSSGSKDITALRDFVTKLNTPSGTLKYVLLLGDTSYDFKNRISGNTDILPSYQSEYSADVKSSYVTDDYFVMTSPQTATDIAQILPNVPIGRLPAANVQEAKLLIDKTLAYYNALPGQSNPFGEWRMKMDFVADDDFDGDGPGNIGKPFHNLVDYAIKQTFETSTDKPEYNIKKLYLDAFQALTSAGGQRFPQVNQAITNDVGNSLYLFYFGHGGVNGWAQERVLTSTEVQGFNNYTPVYSRFPLVSTITCEFTLWDEPGANSVGEQMIKHNTGGAAAMITSSRAISVDYGRKLTPLFTQKLFNLDPVTKDFATLGDAHLAAKRLYGLTYYPGSANASVSDHLRVNFLGDPAMKLSRPKKLIVIDNIDSPDPDKIRALDFVKVTGHVTKADGTVDKTFNGRVAINIFDKKITKTTLNNDNLPDLANKLTFLEEPSAIVKASGKVTNGQFLVEFNVPKDINYTDGDGRIMAYADNFASAGAGSGKKSFDVFTNLTKKVGGINPNGINDTEPPAVNLYMNNINFANGGITDQNPMLLACVKDNMGINSTGSGIGHDITFVLDGDVVNTTAINDYFSSGDGNGCTSNLADYQKGSVTFPLKNLTPGEHQLVFKVWDINNNSTSSTLNFIVKDQSDKKLIVNRLLNWPNPFTNKTYVQFEHNCDDILDVNVQIYTITGKIVRTLSATVSAEKSLEGFRTPRQAIEWDGKDDFGDTVAKGTYIFKIFARSQNQEKCAGGATAVEKMVLLK